MTTLVAARTGTDIDLPYALLPPYGEPAPAIVGRVFGAARQTEADPAGSV